MISGRLFHDVESGRLERNDRDSLRRKMTENRGFFSRHPFQRTEILQMAASDGDDQSRIGTDCLRERFDLSMMICPALQNADFMLSGQPQQILRNTDLIVGVSFRCQHMLRPVRAIEDRPEHLLDAGFSAGSGQRNRLDRKAQAVKARQILIGPDRGIHHDRRRARRKFGKTRTLHAEKTRSLFQRRIQKIMSVELFTGDGEKERVRRGQVWNRL